MIKKQSAKLFEANTPPVKKHSVIRKFLITALEHYVKELNYEW